MEAVVILALSVLATILLFASIIIGYVIRYRFWSGDKLQNIYSILCNESNKAVLLKTEECLASSLEDNGKGDCTSLNSTISSIKPSKLEILDGLLQFNETFLKNQKWAEEVSNLMPHCLCILKLCQNITRRLVSPGQKDGAHVEGNDSLYQVAGIPPQVDSASEYYESSRSHCSGRSARRKDEEGTLDQQLTPDQKTEIITITRTIGPRVDDVVRAMYPPLDPRLLEARLTSLYLAVCHLVYVTNKSTYLQTDQELPKQKHWLKQSIQRIEDNLEVLRKVSLAFDTCIQLQNLDYANANSRFAKNGKPKHSINQNIAVISL